MCSIIGSFDRDRLVELYNKNYSRGVHAGGITVFNIKTSKVEFIYRITTQLTVSDIESIYEYDKIGELYYIIHLQMPTDGVKEISMERVHPIESDKDHLLYHNGLILPNGISYLQQYTNTTETFDTKLLSDMLYQTRDDDDKLSNILSDIEGLFACLYIKKDIIQIFRTRHAKLFIDTETFDISSNRVEDRFKCIGFDIIYNIDFKNKQIVKRHTFQTNKFNITIKGEL